MRSSTCHCLTAAAAVFMVAPVLAADAYPSKPIRVIVPFAPGGATDVLARALSEKMAESLGASVVIDNRGGAGGTIGTALVAQSAPDGYTVMITSPSITFTTSFYKNLTYNPGKDLVAITKLVESPNVFAAHPSMPVRNVKELVALAQKHPGEIRYGSGGHGSNIHLTTALFASMAKVNLGHVPYKGGGPAQIALVSGEVQVMMAGLQPAMPLLSSGRIRALAVTSKTRSPAAPQIPTVHESGVPGYDKAYWAGFFAPAGVPDAIVARLHETALKTLKHPDILKRLAAEGTTAVGTAPQEFTAFVRSEISQWAALIRELKL